VTISEEGRALREAAAVEPAGSGRYSVNISPYYTIAGHPHGGYLQCIMANAALAGASEEGASHLHTTAITTNYSGASEVGPAELVTEVRRIGRGVSFVHVSLLQAGQVSTESLVTLGTLQEDSRARYMDVAVPELAPLEDCLQAPGSDEVNIRGSIDMRLDPSSAGWWTGEHSERGDIRGWMRLNDGDAQWNAWSLLFASDAMPPATFPLGSSGWVPTLQLTTYVRRIPASEWLRARQWCVVIADGIVDERCELFDARGELVASSTQLAMVRLPNAH
jgi:acyl-CoA thioesterase